MREWDISTYHDALMRCQLFPKERSGERLGAGAKLSHAIGEGKRRVHYVSGFDRSRNRIT